ncbi:hypothetical protein [Pseudoruegeria sp. HB172150]|uniref:hypothetical protein n=1 Tax=Pseudoruegeria sp. HB172150 TaxID=2721164 RepID=UPI0015518062|nr:hypothetical protein [Pseudoruegeria sp. HB172150]
MTTADLYLVVGLILIAFAVPSILGAFADRRAPRAAAIVLLIGGGLFALAMNQRPYTLQEIPGAFVRVVAYFVR